MSCNEGVERTTYSGKEYILFAETQNDYAVQPESELKISVASTVACPYDRTVAVEVVNAGSTAIEGVHFDLKQHNVVIKAGELATEVELVGHFENFTPDDKLSTRLRLVVADDLKWDLYEENLETKINFYKFCPFSLESWFENERRSENPEKYNYANYIFYASFPYSETQFQKSLVKVYQDPEDPYRMIVKDPFKSQKDIKIRLHDGGPGENKLTMLPQEVFYSSNYGWISMASMDGGCYYNSCERFMEFQLNCYVDQLGSLGVHPYLLIWVSEHQAEEMRNQGL